jgi:hypothetical protein
MIIDEDRIVYARLHNQYLTRKAPCSVVVSDLCGLQAQFANNPKYALRARGGDFCESEWSLGFVKMWSFRHTLHTVREDELGIFISAAGIPRTWENDWGIEAARMEYLADAMLERIKSGVTEREELKSICRAAGIGLDELNDIFNGWGGLFYEMNRRGMITLHPGTEKKFVPCEGIELLDRECARAIVIARYFKAFSPATMADCAAFTGYKKREITDIIEKHEMSLNSVSLDKSEYFYIGEPPASGEIPTCVYLAGFDQMIMGYKDRKTILDDKFKRHVITISGIVNPTILLYGRIHAKWKKDKTKLIVSLFVKTSKKQRETIAEAGERLFGKDAESGGIENVAFINLG